MKICHQRKQYTAMSVVFLVFVFFLYFMMIPVLLLRYSSDLCLIIIHKWLQESSCSSICFTTHVKFNWRMFTFTGELVIMTFRFMFTLTFELVIMIATDFYFSNLCEYNTLWWWTMWVLILILLLWYSPVHYNLHNLKNKHNQTKKERRKKKNSNLGHCQFHLCTVWFAQLLRDTVHVGLNHL